MDKNILEQLTAPLELSDIELRIGSVSQGKGFSLLAYKTARTDANRLDSTVGVMNWQNEHYIDNKGNVICKIGIYGEDKKEWIWKEDTGTESFTEKEKGSYSDSFKRAGFRWGIGRELYDFPFMWVSWSDWNGKTPKGAYVNKWVLKEESSGKRFIENEKGEVVWKERGVPNQTNTKKTKVTEVSSEPDKPKSASPKTKLETVKEIGGLAGQLKGKKGFETQGKVDTYVSGKMDGKSKLSDLTLTQLKALHLEIKNLVKSL